MSQPDLSSQLIAAQARIAKLEQALAVLEVVKPDLAAELVTMDLRVIYLASVIADRDKHIAALEIARDEAYEAGKKSGWAAHREEVERGRGRIHRDDVRSQEDRDRYKRQEMEDDQRRYAAELRARTEYEGREPAYIIPRKQFEKYGF